MFNNYRVRSRFDGLPISGQVNFEAPEGLMVNYDPTDPVTPLLKQATGTKGYALSRQVVAVLPVIDVVVFPQNLVKTPELVGNHVSASKILEMEVEGPNLVNYSGTGAISVNTAPNTALGLVNGQWRVQQGGDELAGVLRAQLASLATDGSNQARILIQL